MRINVHSCKHKQTAAGCNYKINSTTLRERRQTTHGCVTKEVPLNATACGRKPELLLLAMLVRQLSLDLLYILVSQLIN